MAVRQLHLQRILGLQYSTSIRHSPLSSIAARAFHSSPRSALSDEEALDRNTLNPRRAEYTASGWDDEVAEHPEVAFNPSENRPEYEKEMCTKSCNGSPLELSGANREVSSQTDENKGDKSDKLIKSWGSPGKPNNKKHGHA
ncbi:hypothetical protein B0T18DRAFT_430597 [Schizothecium vesticola]|uniref:Uncharacterized protein n=1 Tax=Schizothecium vesticola TaxID=314040 RepID=A0AA40EPV7_9PEZI|nr:hypothetical protein B0T18DRAFT_430597 [Schizothecium vesticola]